MTYRIQNIIVNYLVISNHRLQDFFKKNTEKYLFFMGVTYDIITLFSLRYMYIRMERR